MRLSQWQELEKERMRMNSIKVGVIMTTLGVIIGYTLGYVVWRIL
jgi:hypothetical protein